MHRRIPQEAWPAAGDPDLSNFGFDRPDEEWLSRVREVERPILVGTIGSFELVEEVSRGAQGVVFRARQPNTGRAVALKRLLSGSFATEAMRARFHREMEAAVALHHPSIVSVYGMEIVDGQPVLAMEWIDGEPIDRWADRSGMGRRPSPDLLGMFLKLCDAVQHAHQRGVTHRDLKPSNILVEPSGEPHVLDFGLAKLVGPADGGAAELTRTQDFLGTPAYAAPEQVRGEHEAVDVRTDVYALGVILYQVLTGRRPFSCTTNLPQLLDSIQHTEADRPSSIEPTLDDEIDAIVLKAMAKEPQRRYQTVDAFAADIRRYLAGDPIDAQRGRRGYVLRKTLQRYKFLALAVAGFMVVLTASAIALSVMYARQSGLLGAVTQARDAETRARRHAQKQQTTLQHILTAVSEIGKGADLPLRRALLDDAAREVQAELADEPEAKAAALDAIGRTYQTLGIYDQAEPYLRSALSMRQALFGAEHLDVAASLNNLGELLLDTTKFRESEPFLREALTIRQRLLGGENRASDAIAESLNNVGLVMQGKHDYEAAEALHRAALAQYRQLHGAESPGIATSLNWVGCSLANRGAFREAEQIFRDVLAMQRRLHGDAHRETAESKIALAKALHLRGDYAGAEPLFREAIATYRELLGDEHDNVAWGLHRLGVLLHAQGRYAEAESHLRASLAIYRKCLGDNDPYVSFVLDSLGTLLMDQGDFAGAEPLFNESVAIWRARHGPESAAVAWKLNRLGELRWAQGDFEAAEPLLRGALTNRTLFAGFEHVYLIRSLHGLGALLTNNDEYVEAEGFYREALELQRSQFGAKHPDVRKTVQRLIDLYDAWGDSQKADEFRTMQEAIAVPPENETP